MFYSEYLPEVIQTVHDGILDFYPKDGFDFYYIAILPTCLLMLFWFLAFRDMIFVQISCWMPHFWTPAYEEYAHDFCWAESTYFMDVNGTPPNSQDQLDRLKINYYQWLPLFILSLAFICRFPRSIWQFCCSTDLLSISSTIRQLKFLLINQKGQLEEPKPVKLASRLHNQLQYSFIDIRSRHKLRNYALFPCYILFKLFLILLSCVLLIFLGRFIQGTGWKFFPWQQSLKTMFPITTFCTVPIYWGVNYYNRTIQCVMPFNVVNDKVCVVIWCLLVLGILLQLIGIIWWLVEVCLPTRQRAFISRYITNYPNYPASLPTILSSVKSKFSLVSSTNKARADEMRFPFDHADIFVLMLLKNTLSLSQMTMIIDDIYTRRPQNSRNRRNLLPNVPNAPMIDNEHYL